MGDVVKGDLIVYVGIGALGLLLACGILGAALARGRGRGAVRWGLLCILFGPLGLIVLACLPKVRRHPVWSAPNARPDRVLPNPALTPAPAPSPTAVRTPVDRQGAGAHQPPSGDGELLRGDAPFDMDLAAEAVDSEEVLLTAPETPVSQAPLTQTPRSALEVGLLESRIPAPEPPPPPPPRSAAAAPAPRPGRAPGVPAGYPSFQVLARRETKIELQCPNCASVFRRPNSLLGKLEKCPECRAVMRIPT